MTDDLTNAVNQIDLPALVSNLFPASGAKMIGYGQQTTGGLLTMFKHTKKCCSCGVSKPLSRFYKDSTKASGYKSDCKECNRIKALRRYHEGTSTQIKARRKRKRAYRLANKEQHREWDQRSKSRFPERKRARDALKRAVEKGALSRPSICEECYAEGKIEAHHSDYSKPLEVEWLCRPCHSKAHTKYNCGETP